MQHCRRAALETIVVLTLACLAGCTSGPQPPTPAAPVPKQAASAPRPEPSGAPLLVPQVITLRAPVKLQAVSGACYVVRGEGSMIAQQGATLQDGDVLDLGNAGDNGSVSLRSGARSEIVLRRASGRFFKLQIRP